MRTKRRIDFPAIYTRNIRGRKKRWEPAGYKSGTVFSALHCGLFLERCVAEEEVEKLRAKMPHVRSPHGNHDREEMEVS